MKRRFSRFIVPIIVVLTFLNLGVACGESKEPTATPAATAVPTEDATKKAVEYHDRGLAFSEQGELELAIEEFSQAIALDPQYAEAYNGRGNAFFGTGDLGQALADFEQAIALDPQLASAYYNRGVAFQNMGELDRALSDYEQVLELDPTFAPAYHNRGAVRFYKGDPDGALADMTKAIELDPDFVDPYYNLGRLYKNWADLSTTDEEKQALIDQSIDYYDQGLALTPQNVTVWNELAAVYLYQKGDPEKAWETIEHSLELDDRFEQTHMIAGDVHLREYELLGERLATKENELSAAESDQKAALETEIAALKTEQDQKLEGAIASYERALEIKPDLTNVSLTVAGAYEQLGRVDDAIVALTNAAAADPTSPDPYLRLAELYQRQGDLEAAVIAYAQASAVKPDDPALRQTLAFTYQRLGRYPEALAEAQAAARLSPDDATLQLLIGDVSRTMNDMQAAAAAYEQALVLAPDLEIAWSVHVNLALIYQAQGELDLALSHARDALDLAPEDQREQINNFIAELETQRSENP